MASEVGDREERKDNKYEAFVAGVLKDFDSRVQAIQTSAEVNMRGRLKCGQLTIIAMCYKYDPTAPIHNLTQHMKATVLS